MVVSAYTIKSKGDKEMSSVKMIKLEDGDYVPEECCTFCRNFETGEMEIDDVILPCGCDCSCGGTIGNS